MKPTGAKPTRQKRPKMPSPDPTSDSDDGNDEQNIVEQTILVDAQGNIIR